MASGPAACDAARGGAASGSGRRRSHVRQAGRVTSFGPDHGSDERTRVTALLRSPPPAAAIDWVCRVMNDAVIDHCEVLRGGSSSAMHLLTVRHHDDRIERVVLRRYVLPAETHEPDVAARGRELHPVAEQIEVLTPTLLASDPTGAEAGVPALLISHLDGRPVWEPRRRQAWCEGLAEALVSIHGVPLPTAGVVQAYAPHQQSSYVAARLGVATPGSGSAPSPSPTTPRSRSRSASSTATSTPATCCWSKSRITGVVDWQHASIGPDGRRRRPQPIEPVLLRRRSGRVVHDHLGTI